MIDCTLLNDINTSCGKMHNGGIKAEVYLYKLPCEVKKVGGLITEINGESYKMYADSLEYAPTNENGVYTHALTGKVLGVSDDTRNALASTKRDRFLVVFRLKSSNELKAFGVDNGALLKQKEKINNDESGYEIELKAVSNLPLYSVDIDVVANKTHKKHWLMASTFCELSDGVQTGYIQASYMVAVDEIGRPLDTNGRLCEESGNNQSAWRLQGQPIGDYHIEGDYEAGESVNGEQTRVYSNVECANELSGTISLDTQSVSINTTNRKSAVVNITTDYFHNWSVIDAYAVTTCSLSETNGRGIGQITISNGKGGSETIRIIDNNTKEIATLVVNSYYLQAGNGVIESGDLSLTIPVVCQGGLGDFSYTTDADDTKVEVERVGNSLAVTLVATQTEDYTFHITLTHNSDSGETKTIDVLVKGADATSPNWVRVASYCEVE